MNRRTFLATGIAPLLSLESFAYAKNDNELAADVVIVGGSLGGCAAALAATRAGMRVVWTEETDWIGGQLTSQSVPPDEHPWIEQFGCTQSYRDLREGIRDYYRKHYPLTPSARANRRLNPGNGNVSKLCHEPKVALAVLTEMLAPAMSSGRLRLLLEHRPASAVMNGDRISAVTVRDLRGGRDRVLTAPVFIDATELGDLLPLTKTEYVIGFESRDQTKEPHAPAEAQPLNQQAFTYCFNVDYLPGEDHTIDKPEDYAFWRDYVPQLRPAWPGKLLSWQMSEPQKHAVRNVSFDPTGLGTGLNLWRYRRIADRANFAEGTYASDICCVNWPQNDYWLGNIVDLPADEIAKHHRGAKQLSLSLVYWMQTEAPLPDGKQGWKGLRLRRDLVDTADGLAKGAYVRESRRILAEKTVVEQEVGTEARQKLTKAETPQAAKFADTVGIGSYRIDLHPSSSGDNYLDISSLPFQIPLGALIPRRVENLLAACKNLGVTHITNGCYRLHPVEWNIGEAAGALAAQAVLSKVGVKQVRNDAKRLAAFQAALVRQGFELDWPKVGPR